MDHGARGTRPRLDTQLAGARGPLRKGIVRIADLAVRSPCPELPSSFRGWRCGTAAPPQAGGLSSPWRKTRPPGYRHHEARSRKAVRRDSGSDYRQQEAGCIRARLCCMGGVAPPGTCPGYAVPLRCYVASSLPALPARPRSLWPNPVPAAGSTSRNADVGDRLVLLVPRTAQEGGTLHRSFLLLLAVALLRLVVAPTLDVRNPFCAPCPAVQPRNGSVGKTATAPSPA
jgi:hypothetical protein